MNSTLAKIYTLIMLECRLPLEDASEIFGIKKEVLEKELQTKTIFYCQLKYLEIECASYPSGNARARWKSEIYFRRLQRILRTKPKEEKIRLLNDFILALSGPDISFAITKKSGYTDKEKERILKYRLKYALSGENMEDAFHVCSKSLARWEAELSDDSELKIRLEILRDYLNYGYQEIRLNNRR